MSCFDSTLSVAVRTSAKPLPRASVRALLGDHVPELVQVVPALHAVRCSEDIREALAAHALLDEHVPEPVPSTLRIAMRTSGKPLPRAPSLKFAPPELVQVVPVLPVLP